MAMAFHTGVDLVLLSTNWVSRCVAYIYLRRLLAALTFLTLRRSDILSLLSLLLEAPSLAVVADEVGNDDSSASVSATS
jgi:hypothetical protein